MLLSPQSAKRRQNLLSRPKKFPPTFIPGPVDFRRREFLIRSGQLASAALLAPSLRAFGSAQTAPPNSPLERLPSGQFHLHPHYRTALPLDPLLAKTESGLDDFITEQYADQITAILSQWSESLLRLPTDMAAFEKTLHPNFTAASPIPVESQTVRPGPPIEIRRNKFAQALSQNRTKFLSALRTTLSQFDRIRTAEFQVTGIGANALKMERRSPALSGANESPLAPNQLRIAIRYELVGQGSDLHFEQRVGTWDQLWELSSNNDWKLLTWQSLEETQSRCPTEAFRDITQAALRHSPALDQLQHGSDYWRTVLDGACGIDIYGHNGVSVADINNDGFDDLYVCQPGGIPNRLFRNRGDGTFEDITESSGVGVIENTACALFVDVNNNGHQDLIVVKNSGPLLFLNDGTGKFHQKPNAFQFAQPPQGTFVGAAVADYDRDGWLDVYFCLYIYYQGANQYKYPSPYFDAENGPPNFLMRNNRDGTFRDATAETGLSQNNNRYSFCCGWNDFNRDGWPDLYVVNDFGRKNLYRNNGDGTFTDIAAESGVEDIGAGMSVCWFDYDNDGYDDLYVANMWTAAGERITMQDEFKKNSPAEVRALYHKHAMGNSLFKNECMNSSVTSVSSVVKDPSPAKRNTKSMFWDTTDLSCARIGRWAWSSDSFDFDHDGFPDLYIANGMVSSLDRNDLNSFFWRQVVANSPDEPKPSHDYEQGWGAINELIRADRTWSGYERNIFYANNGDGTFSDISGAINLDFLEDGRSFALADFDLDGRQEVFLKNRNAPQLRILHNNLPNLPPSISFRLQGTKSNRDAIGAVVTIAPAIPIAPADPIPPVETRLAASPQRDPRTQTRSIQAGSGFISQHSKDVFFGLGNARGPMTAKIHWPSGQVQEFQNLPPNHRIWIEEGTPQPTRIEPFRETPQPGWYDASLPSNSSRDLWLSEHTIETWLLAPVAAPDFSLPNKKGTQQSLGTLRGKPVLLHFGAAGDDRTEKDWSNFTQHDAKWRAQGLQLVSINFSATHSATEPAFPILQGTDDVAAIYSILFRYLFDRHRDLDLPTSFLINSDGEIVKVYQGPIDPEHIEHDARNIPATSADRMSHALPYPGVAEVTEFGRNYLSFGSVYFQRGYLDQAAAAFQIALRDDPESAEALYGIGSVNLDQQKNKEARDCFERALKLRASYPDTLANAWNNLGLLAGREGRVSVAITNFQEALKLSPDHLIALNNLGSAFRQSKRWEEAKQTYEKGLALKPTDAEANYGMGMIYAQKEDNARAEESLKKALQLRPTYPEALNNLGILYLRTNRRDQAVANFKWSIAVAPEFDQSYLNLARVYAVEGNPEEARKVLEDLLTRHPNNPAAQQMLSQLSK